VVFEAAEVVAPEGAGAFAGGADAGGKVEADAEEGGLRGRRGSGFWLRLVLRENGCARAVAEREELCGDEDKSLTHWVSMLRDPRGGQLTFCENESQYGVKRLQKWAGETTYRFQYPHAL